MAGARAAKPFAGQVALVTGASRGIGAATAETLAAAGAHVILTARTAKDLEKVEDAIHGAGGNATIAPLDLAEPDAIARLAVAIAKRWDALDILVLNAGFLPQPGPVVQIEPKQLGQAFTVNVLAAQALIAAFDPLLKRSKDARVVGITSTVGREPRAYWGGYAASKAAFEMLLECYAQEVERISNIRVAIVNPGATRTAMRARAFPGEDPQSVKPPEAVAKALVALLEEPFESGIRKQVDTIG
jgi:NAD(P)-dependent dehydrogenase (short-subunit alcohol dehydrogenase family)